MKKFADRQSFTVLEYIVFAAVTIAVMAVCVCLGSYSVPLREVLGSISAAVFGTKAPEGAAYSVVMLSRLPRVICVGLGGAALSLSGAAMQGLLKNPLADGSTLGVASGASLGAVIAIAFGSFLPPVLGTAGMAMIFAFGSLVLILGLAFRLDYTLSTNTIILIGVIFSMFISSIISLIVTFASTKVKSIMFWTMGSFAGSSYTNALTLLCALVLFGSVLLCLARELNAFAVGEDNARNIGVNVRAVKIAVLICSAGLIGVTVSVAGTIGFVGLVIPHMTRMLTGPNHKKLLPATMFVGAVFLMLADLLARVILNPLELPIGVVTSFIGSVTFIWIFFRSRKAG